VRVNGYRFSPRNQSLDPLNQILFGRVNADTAGLRVVMEPGTPKFVAPSGREAVEAQRRLQDEPLRGVPTNG
jgi:hypothetical protein